MLASAAMTMASSVIGPGLVLAECHRNSIHTAGAGMEPGCSWCAWQWRRWDQNERGVGELGVDWPVLRTWA